MLLHVFADMLGMGSGKTDVQSVAGKLPPQLSSRFVARQPILTGDEKVFGYELLFRDGVENCFGDSDSEIASRSVLDSSMLMGYDILCDGRRAFLNCTREVLL